MPDAVPGAVRARGARRGACVARRSDEFESNRIDDRRDATRRDAEARTKRLTRAPTRMSTRRFHAATRVGNSSAARSFFSDETRLVLFALERQATRGALATTREERGQTDAEALAGDAHLAEGDPRALKAMARAWEELGTMSANEAMRLYVKVLDEEKPNWWDAEARRASVARIAGCTRRAG